MYDPRVGRWTTQDPMGLAAGDNEFEFVANDPTNETDPSGLAPFKKTIEQGELTFDVTVEEVIPILSGTVRGKKGRVPVAITLNGVKPTDTVITVPVTGFGMGLNNATVLNIEGIDKGLLVKNCSVNGGVNMKGAFAPKSVRNK